MNICWKPSVAGLVTINIGGASKEGGRECGCGGVIRDKHSRWLTGFTRYLCETNSYVTELWDALDGLKFPRSKG